MEEQIDNFRSLFNTILRNWQMDNLSEFIAGKLARQLIYEIPKLSFLTRYQHQRPHQIKQQSLDYMQKAFESIGNLQSIKYSQPKQCSVNPNNQQNFIQNYELNREKKSLNIYKKKSTTSGIKLQRSVKNTPKQSKLRGSIRGSIRSSHKNKLIKLKSEEEEEQGYAEYVQKLRQKKIRLAEALGEFEETQNDIKGNFIDNQNKTLHPAQQKALITNYEGEIIKTDRKNPKKESNWFDKNKVKPQFRLKQPMETHHQILKYHLGLQILRNNEKNSLSGSLKVCGDIQGNYRQDTNINIKSIMDVFTTRNVLNNIRSRKIVNYR